MSNEFSNDLQSKLQWILHNDNIPIKTELADKYKAKFWVENSLDHSILFANVHDTCNEESQCVLDILGGQLCGKDYIVPTLGVWDSFDDIDFDSLPDLFWLKCNHGCRWNCEIKKDEMDVEALKSKFTKWMQEDYSSRHGELHYKNIPRKIIAEPWIDHRVQCQFYCTNGKPRFVVVVNYGVSPNTQTIFDMDGRQQPFWIQKWTTGGTLPATFERLKWVAKQLCKDFILVRVDLYAAQDKVFFSEMTFTPRAMKFFRIEPEEYAVAFSEMLCLDAAEPEDESPHA